MKLQAISMFEMHLLILTIGFLLQAKIFWELKENHSYYVETNMNKDIPHTPRETAKGASHRNERQPTMKNKISGAEHRSKSKANENLKMGRKGVQKGRTWYNHSCQLTYASAKLDTSSAYGGRR